MFRKFTFISSYNYTSGWDKYAEEYSRLLQPGTVYNLTKEISHKTLLSLLPSNEPITVLDLNCGTGNDFPFFLEQGWNIVGCDGSEGMLNKAAETYQDAIASGKIELYCGMIETLDATSFSDKKFNLIYSITGGFSYVDDSSYISVHQQLGHYLAENGVMVTAHLTKCCLPEILFHASHLNMKKALLRMRKKLQVNIKGETFRMYLRGPSKLKKLIVPGLTTVKILPLLAFTPPYQTGFRISKKTYKLLSYLESRTSRMPFFSRISDQVITVYKKSV